MKTPIKSFTRFPKKFKYLPLLSLYLLLLSIAFYIAPLAAQVQLPPINLGSTSFMDGIAGPGTLVESTFNHYRADKLIDNKGDRIPQDAEIRSSTNLFLIAHITEKTLFGGYYGFETLIPVVDLKVDIAGEHNHSGIGDILVSPFLLQWPNRSLFGMPFSHRLNLLFSLPTGSYKSDRAVNLGSNAVNFNPYYAFTLKPTDKVEASFRLHYLWNDKNDDPNLGEQINTTQAGDAFHINFATSYQLTNHLRLGLSGFYLKQLSAHKINGVSQSNMQETAVGIGPGLMYEKNLFKVVLNTYADFNTRNRPEGHRYILKFSKVF